MSICCNNAIRFRIDVGKDVFMHWIKRRKEGVLDCLKAENKEGDI